MWPLERNVQFAVPHQSLKRLCDRRRLQDPNGGSLPQKYPPVRRRWRTALKMLRQSRCDLIGERQLQRRTCLRLVNAENALSPRDVLQRQFHHLTGAQAVGGDQEKHRVVAPSDVRTEIERLQQL